MIVVATVSLLWTLTAVRIIPLPQTMVAYASLLLKIKTEMLVLTSIPILPLYDVFSMMYCYLEYHSEGGDKNDDRRIQKDDWLHQSQRRGGILQASRISKRAWKDQSGKEFSDL